MNYHPARSAEGVLIRTIDGEWVFRVYSDDHSYVDFDVNHGDLQITITDTDAYFYQKPDGKLVLDHAPTTLGIE